MRGTTKTPIKILAMVGSGYGNAGHFMNNHNFNAIFEDS